MSFLGFGKKSAVQKFQPTGFSGGGLTATPNGNTISVTPDNARTGLIGNIQSTFTNLANETAGLRASVTPGFGDLTRARLAEIESGRQKAIGNLAQNLQNRRIFGSSFGQASLAQAEREFAQAREKARSESFLQELDANNQLLQQEFQARAASFQTALDELNLEAQIGTQLSTQATSELGANARLQAQLDAQSASGFGKLLGTVIGVGAKIAAPQLFAA